LKGSGFTFSQPKIPSFNSLERLSFDEFFDMEDLALYQPSFPPRSLQEIIRLVDEGKSQNISIFEWLDATENHQQWSALSKDEAHNACRAMWTAICTTPLLSDIAFFKTGLALDGKASSIVTNLVDTMKIARSVRGLMIDIANKLDWLLALQDQNFQQLAAICFNQSLTPKAVIKRLKLPQANSYTPNLIKPLIGCIRANNINESADQWLKSCFDNLNTTNQKIAFLDQLIVHLDKHQYPIECAKLIEQYCFPNEDDSYWYSLSDVSQNHLKAKYNLSNYYELKAISRMLLSEEAIRVLALSEIHSAQIRSRSMFWSNYSSRFDRIRVLVPQLTFEFILHARSKAPLIMEAFKQTDADSEVFIFELGKIIVVEFLRGTSSETRIFNNNEWNGRRLFDSDTLSLEDIRAMSQLDVHDHVIYWQCFCEKMLRTKFKILPNDDIPYFKGLPPAVNRYSELRGLPTPDKLMLTKRAEQLEQWVDLFWQQELPSGKYGDLKGLEKRSNVYLSKAQMAKQLGDVDNYDLYIKKAANQGNPEAMWQLGRLMLLGKDARLRKHGEEWIVKAASKNHKEALETAKKFRLSVTDASLSDQVMSEFDLCLKSLRSVREFDHKKGIELAVELTEEAVDKKQLADALLALLKTSKNTEIRLTIADLFLKYELTDDLQKVATILSSGILMEQEKSIDIYYILHATYQIDINDRVQSLVAMASDYHRKSVMIKGLTLLSNLGDAEATYKLASILIGSNSNSEKEKGLLLIKKVAQKGHKEAIVAAQRYGLV
jgi:TPR repeat protein